MCFLLRYFSAKYCHESSHEDQYQCSQDSNLMLKAGVKNWNLVRLIDVVTHAVTSSHAVVRVSVYTLLQR